MSPKEKATEMVELFMTAPDLSKKMSDYSRIYWPTAKVCALLAVSEIKKVIGESPYWNEVIQEIKNL